MQQTLFNPTLTLVSHLKKSMSWCAELSHIFEMDINAFTEISDVNSYEISHSRRHLFQWRRLVTNILAASFPLSVNQKQEYQESFFSLLKNGYWDSFTIYRAYVNLVQELLDLPSRGAFQIQQSEFNRFESAYHWLDGDFEDLLIQTELVFLSLVLGLLQDQPSMVELAVEASMRLMNFFDHEGVCLAGLWSAEKYYCQSTVALIVSLLFSLIEQLTSSKRARLICESQRNVLLEQNRVRFKFTPEAYLCFPFLFDRAAVKVEKHKLDIQNHTLYDKHRAIFVQSGINTGLGLIKKEDVEISSMGPHWDPLGQSMLFGLFQKPFDGQEVFIESSLKDEIILDRCVRIVGNKIEDSFADRAIDAIPSSVWMHTQISKVQDRFELKTLFSELPNTPQLYFVFFVKSHQIVINQSYYLRPGSLHRYEGKPEEIVLEGLKSKLILETDPQTSMKVIPLSGGNFFWGSNFLVAYAVDKPNIYYNWNIR